VNTPNRERPLFASANTDFTSASDDQFTGSHITSPGIKLYLLKFESVSRLYEVKILPLPLRGSNLS
jgi:hypothetical protein